MGRKPHKTAPPAPTIIIVAIPLLLLLLYKLFDLHIVFNNESLYGAYQKLTIIQKELLGGQFPFWNPYEGSGGVLFAVGNSRFPEILGLFFLSVKDTLVLGGIFHVFLGLTSFYLFARAIDLSPNGALLGAVVWAFNGYHAWHLNGLDKSGSIFLLPFILFCYVRFVQRGGTVAWMVVASLAFGFQALHGRPTGLAYGFILVFFFCLYDTAHRIRGGGLASRWLPEAGKTLGFVAGVVILGLMLSAFYTLPFAENLLKSTRFQEGSGGYIPTIYRDFVAIPEFLFPGFVRRIFMNKQSFEFFRGNGWYLDSRGFFGLATLPFLILSWKATGRFRSFFLFVAAFVALCLFPVGLFDLLRRLPFHGGAFMAIRLIPLLMLAIAALIGMGYDRLFPRGGVDREKAEVNTELPGRVCFPVLIVLGALALGGLVGINVERAYHWPLVVIVGLSLLAILLTHLAARGRMREGVAYYGLIAVLLVTLFIANQSDTNDGFPGDLKERFFQIDPRNRMVQFLQGKTREGFIRVADSEVRRRNFLQRYFVSTIPIGGNAISKRYMIYFMNLAEEKSAWPGDYYHFVRNVESPFYDLASVTHLLVKDDRAQSLPAELYPKVFYNALENAWVLENTRAYPRFYFVSGLKVIEDDEETLAFMARKGKGDPDWFRGNVVLSEAPGDAFSPGSPEGAVVLRVDYRENRVEMDVKAPEPTLLVFLDSFDEGWRVSIDGKPGRILRANYLFRAVPLRAGEHRLEFWYLPTSFVVGSIISVVTLIFLLALLGFVGFRNRKVSSASTQNPHFAHK